MAWIRLFFGFKGRIGRAKYLLVELALLALWLTPWLKLPSFGSPQVGYWLTALVMIWIDLAVTAKRLHDRDRSGWWSVAVFAVNRLSLLYYTLFFSTAFGVDIPIAEVLLLAMLAVGLTLLQTWIIIELFFIIGSDGPNRFGPDPTRDTPSPFASRPDPAGVPDFLISRSGPHGGL